MKTEKQDQLLKLYDEGYSIKINSIYVSGMVFSMHKREDTGEIVYSDDVFSDRPLNEVSTNEVDVYQQIDDWEDHII